MPQPAAPDARPLPAEPRTAWRGRWTWTHPDETPAEDRNAYAFFRREFNCPSDARLAIHISADSAYTLSLDGRRLHRGPARSHHGAWAFDTLEPAVAAGRHCLGVLVHHVGIVNATMMLGRPAWLADITLDAGGSPSQDLSSGAGWQCLAADCWRREFPEMMSHFGYPEELDWRRFPAGWDRPGFDAAGWRPAVAVAAAGDSPWGALVARGIALLPCMPVGAARPAAAGAWQPGASGPMPSTTAAQRLRTRSPEAPRLPWRTPPAPGHAGHYLTVNFGRVISGYPVIRFASSSPGQAVDILYDELASAGTGAVNPERTYAKYADRHILPGGPCKIRSTHPRGFQFLTLDIEGTDTPAEVVAVTADEEVYPFEMQPVFTASDAELTRLVRQSVMTVRTATADAFMDCPTRERVQWMQDLYIHALVALDACGDSAMPRRALFEGARSQLPDGRINGFFPSERTNCAFASSTLLWLLLLEEYWLHTGSDDDLRRLLPTARRTLDLLASLTDADGLLSGWKWGQFWSWEPIEGTGTILLTQAFYLLVLERFAAHDALAQALGADARQRADRLRQAARQRLRLPGRGVYSDAILPDGTLSPVCSQFANAMAALAGVCPQEERAALLRRIIDPASLGPVPLGEDSLKPERDRLPGRPLVPVGTLFAGHWLCRALFECGLDAEALAQMRLLWLPYRDSVTLPETRRQHGNTGFCHGWAGGPAFLLPRYALGLRIEAPRRAVFAPCPGDLTQASGAIPHGPEAHWRRQADGSLHWQLTIPQGWRVRIPGAADASDLAGPWRGTGALPAPSPAP